MIYLDYNATTPILDSVLNTALPYFTEIYANASSTTYAMAWRADEAVRKARKQVADLLAVDDSEIYFTSGATESLNMVLMGLVDLYRGATPVKPLHIITSATEHSAVIDTCKHLSRRNVRITYLDVDKNGLINLEDLQQSITNETIIVCIGYANNETGLLQPIQEISKICRKFRVPLCSDTTQAIGKIPCHPRNLGIDIACVSGHKIYGMKGTGALYLSRISPRIRINPIIHGGGQEKGMRSGTLNVPGIVALGAAAQLCSESDNENERIKALREILEEKLLRITGAQSNVSRGIDRLPNVINISFKDIKSEKLIARINQQLAISLGSACNAGTGAPSRVLQAMGVSEQYIHGSIRISLGRPTTLEEIEQAASILTNAIEELTTTNHGLRK